MKLEEMLSEVNRIKGLLAQGNLTTIERVNLSVALYALQDSIIHTLLIIQARYEATGTTGMRDAG